MQDKPTKVIGQRVAAFLIDGVVLFAFSAIIFFLMADKESEILRGIGSGDVSLNETLYINAKIGDEEYSIVGGGKFALYLLIIHGFALAYMGIYQGIKGATLGKLALGIRTVDAGGQAPGAGKGIVRWLFIGLLPVDSFFLYVVGLVTMASTQWNQRVGDLVAKTYVVKKAAFGQPVLTAGGGGGGYAAAPVGGYGSPPPVGGYGQPQGGYSPPPPVPAAASGGQKADWYPDPQGQARLRYWDGNQWTEHTSA